MNHLSLYRVAEQDRALVRAEDRDLCDAALLSFLESETLKYLRIVGPRLRDLQHPGRRWSPEEIETTMREMLINLADEKHRVTQGPIVCDDGDGV